MTTPSIFVLLLVAAALGCAAWNAAFDEDRTESLRPMTAQEFEELCKSVTFGEEDVKWLRESKSILEPRLDRILDTWYGFVGSNPHLLYYFTRRSDGKPDDRYLAAVRERFGQWVLDTADARFDDEWLAKQLELGLRHHRLKKNKTDGVDSVPIVHFRHLVALVYPLTATLRPFLEESGRPEAEIDAMQEAWRKIVLITAILWSRPYVHDEDY